MVLEELKSNNVEAYLDSTDCTLTVKGPIGSLKKRFGGSDVVFSENKMFFLSESSFRTYKSILSNAIEGVTEGYKVELNLVGLGFKVVKLGNNLLLKLGHSHYIKFANPSGMHLIGSKKRILIFGLDKAEVNKVANILRTFRKPDAYKGKGVQNVLDNISLKVGKQK